MEVLVFVKKSRDRASDTRISLNKLMIEVDEAQKDLDILNGGRNRPLSNSDDSIGLHRDAIRGNNKTKKRD